jgi:formamidopyrimidine-DNA glycosylase
MPELPEVETVCRGLAIALEGRVLTHVAARRKTLRLPLPCDFAKQLIGRRVLAIRRRAKYILIHMDGDLVLIAHLGMSGRMIVVKDAKTPFDKHDHVVFTADTGVSIRYNDARRFGLMTLATESELANHPLLAGIGPEPLGNDFNGPALAVRLAGRKTPIKSALLDQSVVAGVGNIYACEALFFAGISPRRLARTVQGERAERLARAIRDVLTRAIAAGGSSLRDHVQPSGELGYFQHAWAVYGREGERCPGCDCAGAIKRMVQANRSTFYCATRQH